MKIKGRCCFDSYDVSADVSDAIDSSDFDSVMDHLATAENFWEDLVGWLRNCTPGGLEEVIAELQKEALKHREGEA